MTATLNEIDRLKMKRRQLEIDIKNTEDKVSQLKEDKKAIDNKIVMLVNSGKNDGNQSFGRMF